MNALPVADTLEPIYSTSLGTAYCGDALNLLDELAPESVDIIITLPPFALLRQKRYGRPASSPGVLAYVPDR